MLLEFSEKNMLFKERNHKRYLKKEIISISKLHRAVPCPQGQVTIGEDEVSSTSNLHGDSLL